MKKRSSNRLIEKINHGPFEAEIRMNDMGVFSCEYGGFSESGTLPAVRDWARITLRNLCNLKWQPIMEVYFDAQDCNVNNLENTSNINCRMERFWIAWEGQKWIQCPWVVDRPGSCLCSPHDNSEREQEEMPADVLMAQRIAKSREFWYGRELGEHIQWPLVNHSHDDMVYHLPFTEERWQTMKGILDKIRELRAGINRLLGSNQGWLVLAKVAATKMLPAPEQS